MKKLILLALFAVVKAGCTFEGQDMSDVYVTCIIDSCEYVVISGVTEPTHKGNCRFCVERDSIKWEKRKTELIKELRNE